MSPRLMIGVLAAIAGFFTQTAFAAEPRPAQGASREAPLPRGIATWLERMGSEGEFFACVDGDIQKKQLSSAGLAQTVASKGLSNELFKAVTDPVDNVEAILAGFQPTATDADEVLAEKSMHVISVLARADDAKSDAFDGMAAVKGFYSIVHRAIDSDCAVPTHLQAGKDPLASKLKTLEFLIEESHRVKICAAAEMEKRGLDEDAAFAQLDQDPAAGAMRAYVLDLIDGKTDISTEQRAALAKTSGIAAPVRRFSLLTAMTMDVESLTWGLGVHSVYLDRALKSGCNPNKELIHFLGVPSRAN